MKVLVTGAGGFLGGYVVDALLKAGHEVRAFVRSNTSLAALLAVKGRQKCDVAIGDIRDEDDVVRALDGMEAVLHLAAVKYVDVAEKYPVLAVETNIGGLVNLLDNFGGHTFVFMSSDKAASPFSCYGATKLVGEKLVLGVGAVTGGRYMAVRSGNIWGSVGSVLPLWKRQARGGGTIGVTAPDMTRFFVLPTDLAAYIVWLLEHGEGGCIYAPNQFAVRLGDLATAFVNVHGGDVKVDYVGVRAGEKMHEAMYADGERVVYDGAQYSNEVQLTPVSELEKLVGEWL